MTNSSANGSELRLLVAIISYGQKNVPFLKRVIDGYRRMPMHADIVVLSEARKDLGPDVKVQVGLPTRNPWSLGFAHKPLFAKNVDRYDLFAYSEDDIEVTAAHIEAFLRATAVLAPDELAGFIRYEMAEGERYFPDAHGTFRWKPESVRRRGKVIIAEPSNEHAAFYLLNRAHLKKAIASGGFLRQPAQERYDMLCAAATDPYTRCGFRKVICISELPDFLVHHMSNRYAGNMGVAESFFLEQLDAVVRIEAGRHPATTLCNVESKMQRAAYSKNCYERPRKEILGLIPVQARTVLSVGAGWGATETELQRTGHCVTAMPVDSVNGAIMSQRGIEVVFGTLSECLTSLRNRKFDCILLSDLLHLLPNPESVLRALADLTAPAGNLIVGTPNFRSVSAVMKRICRFNGMQALRSFDDSGINIWTPRRLTKFLQRLGFRTVAVNWFDRTKLLNSLALPRRLEPLFTRNWVLRAEAQPNSESFIQSESRVVDYPEPAHELG